jgi:GNAT superfamily N-acetyltransferase
MLPPTPLHPGAEPILGLGVRPAQPADHATYARLFPELNTGDPVPSPQRFTEGIQNETWVLEDGSRGVAFVYFQVLAGVAYVRQLVVDPAHQGRGLGRALLLRLAHALRNAGLSEWHLNVKPDNVPALRTYTRLGMKPAYQSTAFRLLWSQVAHLPPAQVPVFALVVRAEQDHAVEHALHLLNGQLAQLRSTGTRVLLQLRTAADQPVGVAAFDPGFPGSFPFRVAHPSLARALLEAMRPHARPEHPHVGVVVEDDAALQALMRSVGAEVRMDITHMVGPLSKAI